MPVEALYWRATHGYQSPPSTPKPARTWRANGGYKDIEASHSAAQQSPAMFYPPWYCAQWAGQQYVRGPVPVNAVCSTPRPYWGPLWGVGGAGTPPPPYPVAEMARWKISLEQKVEETEGKKERKKDEKGAENEETKEEQKPLNPHAPPKIDEGVNYMFPPGHTMLHIFSKAAPIWCPKYRRQNLKFKIFKTPTCFTPKLIVEKVLCRRGDECQGWAVTEVHEKGDGVWAKGVSIEYTSDKAGNVLPEFGWSTKRGGELPPVWLVVHKV